MHLRNVLATGFSLWMIAQPSAWAVTNTTVVAPRDWTLTGTLDEAYARHTFDAPTAHYHDLTLQHTILASLHYGLTPGTELFINTPVLSLGQTTVNNVSPGQSPAFFSVVGGGARIQWLEDSGTTPACIFETELSAPTGPARFRDYAAYLDHGAAPLTSARQQCLQLTVGGVTSTYLDPVELRLGLHYLTPGHDAFAVNGIQHSVDFGQCVKADAGISAQLSRSLSVALQGQCLSTSATVWRCNGQNVLDAPNTSAEATSLQTHALGGVFLHPALEAYVGPAVTFSAQPGWDVTLSCRVGVTPDSDTLRVRLDVTKLFKHLRFQAKKNRGVVKRSPRDAQALSRRQQSEEIQALLDQAEEALHREDLADAVTAWREVLRRNPKNARALRAFRDYQDEISEAVKQLYLDGMQAYVQNDYAGAIEQWQEALRYAPNDPKVLSSIAQTQKKLESLRQIKRQTPTPVVP